MTLRWLGRYERAVANLAMAHMVNRFPGMAEACSKVALSDALKAAGGVIAPPTLVLPRDKDLIKMLQWGPDEEEGNAPTYILKPDDGAKGEGIRLVRTKQQLAHALREPSLRGPTNSAAVLQRYIERPLLLDG